MRRARWRNARDATSVEAAVTTAADTEADGEATEAAVVGAAGDSARRERLTPPRGARRGRVSAGGRYEECHVGTSTCRPGPNVGDYRYEASQDRKSTRLNSSHSQKSYSVFFLTKK